MGMGMGIGIGMGIIFNLVLNVHRNMSTDGHLAMAEILSKCNIDGFHNVNLSAFM